MSSYVFELLCGDGKGSFRPAQVQVQTRPKALTAQPHPSPRPSSAPRTVPLKVLVDAAAQKGLAVGGEEVLHVLLVLAEPGLLAHLHGQPMITLFLWQCGSCPAQPRTATSAAVCGPRSTTKRTSHTRTDLPRLRHTPAVGPGHTPACTS